MAPKVYHIWLVLQPSGIGVLDISINPISNGEITDIGLLSGLLSAFMSFSKKMLNEPIKILETGSYQIVFTQNEKFFTAVLTDSKIPKGLIERIINRMIDIGTKKYPEILDDDFKADVSIFEKIKEELEELLELKGLSRIKMIHSMHRDIKSKEKMKDIENYLKSLN